VGAEGPSPVDEVALRGQQPVHRRDVVRGADSNQKHGASGIEGSVKRVPPNSASSSSAKVVWTVFVSVDEGKA
jgi:hypothetical protein